MAPPKGKGKDLSRMSAPPQPPAAAPAPSPVAAARVASPRAGKPKGKDFSRMTGPPSAVAQQPPPTVAAQPPPVVPTQPPTSVNIESIRRQNAARVAAGMAPITHTQATAGSQQQQRPPGGVVNVDNRPRQQPMPVPVHNRRPSAQQVMASQQTSLQPPQQHQPLMPNAPQQFKQQQQQQLQQQQQSMQAQQMQRQQQQQQVQRQQLLKQQQQQQQQQAQAQKQQQLQAQKQQQLQAQKQQQLQAQKQQQQQQQQQKKSIASTSSTNAAIHPLKAVQQATQRPGWGEARLSTMDSGAVPSTVSRKPDGYGRPSLAPILGEKLQTLCNSVDPSYALDSEVQERLVEMADSFVDKVTKDAIKLARHRGSNNLDVVDVALALKKGYNMEVPGLGPPSVAGAGGSGQNALGGWLFAEKVDLGGGEEPPKKKSRAGGTAATAAAM